MDLVPQDVAGVVGSMLSDSDLLNFCVTQKFVARAVRRVLRGRAAARLTGIVGKSPATLPDGLALVFLPGPQLSPAEADREMARRRSTLISLLRGVSAVELDSVFRLSHGCGAEGFIVHMVRYLRPGTFGAGGAAGIARLLMEVPGFRYGAHRDEWGRSTSAYLRAKIRANERPALRDTFAAILAIVETCPRCIDDPPARRTLTALRVV